MKTLSFFTHSGGKSRKYAKIACKPCRFLTFRIEPCRLFRIACKTEAKQAILIDATASSRNAKIACKHCRFLLPRNLSRPAPPSPPIRPATLHASPPSPSRDPRLGNVKTLYKPCEIACKRIFQRNRLKSLGDLRKNAKIAQCFESPSDSKHLAISQSLESLSDFRNR